MAEMATWSAIKSHVNQYDFNLVDLPGSPNYCPTKLEVGVLNNGRDSNIDPYIKPIGNSLNFNELVSLSEISVLQRVYTFEHESEIPALISAKGTTTGYNIYIYSHSREKVDGVLPTDKVREDYTIEYSDTWFYEINSGGVTGGKFLTIGVEQNKTTSRRSGTIKFTQKYSGAVITVNITQEAGSKVYTEWEYFVSIDKTSFTYEGGQANITGKRRTRSYTWNGVAGSGSTETENAVITVPTPTVTLSGNTITIPINNGPARELQVEFRFGSGSATVRKYITITQEGGQVTYVDHLSIDPRSKVVAGGGGTFDVIVDANYDKYLNGVYQDNIKAEYTSAEVTLGSASDITITRTTTGCSIKVVPNQNEAPRSYKVKFTYDTADPVILDIIQSEGVVTYYTPMFRQGKSLDALTTSSLSFNSPDYLGGSVEVYLESYRDKRINGVVMGSEPVEPSLVDSGVGHWSRYIIEKLSGYSDKYKLTLTYPTNTENSQKTRRYVLNNGAGYDLVGFLYHTANPYIFEFGSKSADIGEYTDLGLEVTFSGLASAIWFNIISSITDSQGVKTYQPFTAVNPGVDWLSFDLGSGPDSTSKQVHCIVTTNYTGVDRVVNWVFLQGGSIKTLGVKITQQSQDSRVWLSSVGGHVEWCFVLGNSTATLNIDKYLKRGLYACYISAAAEITDPKEKYGITWSPVDGLVVHTIDTNGIISRSTLGTVGTNLYCLVWRGTSSNDSIGEVYANFNLAYGEKGI